MHLIFIRHGDPDYKNNTVTEKGKIEAELLSKRMLDWKITDLFCSPYGRAQDTLKPFLEKTGRTAETMEWLREFDVKVYDDYQKRNRSVPWDLMPEYYFREKKYADIKDWTKTKIMKSGDCQGRYEEVCNGIDSILESYDYNRLGADLPIYNCMPHLTEEEALIDTHTNQSQKNLDEKNLVFVCHLGVMFAIISHLTGISPVQLWQGFFIAPSSVTVLGAEERVPGEVVFRVQQMGDIRHLTENHETASASGFFGNFTEF